MRLLALALLASTAAFAPGSPAATSCGDLAARVADRAAVEWVYAAHRIGSTQRPPESSCLLRETVEALVREEVKKEAVLQQAYGVTIRSAQVAAEVERINATTRAPETLAELKHALGNDPARFANAVARPILVERELQAHFENDNQLHASQRRLAEQARAEALAARGQGVERQIAALRASGTGTVNDAVIWQLMPRLPAADDGTTFGAALPSTPASATLDSRSYSVEATAQVAQMLSAPSSSSSPPGKDNECEKCYFADLAPDLQRVLNAQLQKTGDVSAVIELPTTFLVVIAREKTSETLKAASFSLPKCSYEAWLAEQRCEN